MTMDVSTSISSSEPYMFTETNKQMPQSPECHYPEKYCL
jgi:hypothetical protein